MAASHGSGQARAATLRDVARAAGVSASTVSHVVNETRPVAAATLRRVRAAIADLGYRPSAVARALKADRTGTVGMLVTSSTNPFFAEVIRGFEAGCFGRGYSVILGNTGDVAARLEAYRETLLAKRIDGLAVMTTNMDHGFLAGLAASRGLGASGGLGASRAAGGSRPVPVVAIDTRPLPGVTVVTDDSVLGGALAGRYLCERGFRRIAVVTGPAGHPRSEQRLAGFRAALAEAGIAPDPDLAVVSDLTIGGGFAAVGELLGRGDGTLPEALFCLNDLLAVGALCALARRGLAVPRDISVIGYDDVELAAYTVPPLTTIRQPAAEIGRAAAGLLIDQIEGRADARPALALSPVLVERESVGRAGPIETGRAAGRRRVA